MWMLYAFALIFGVADAFFYPAQTAIVPELVDGEQLQKANGIVQGTAQLAVLVGPALAGVAIAALDGGTSSPVLSGVGFALLIDGATFVISIFTLLLIASRQTHVASEGSVVHQIAEGIRFVWKAPVLLVVMLLSMCANLLITGPTEVGLPLLAYSRLPEGAAAFGLILSAFGGGSLIGLLAATALPRPSPERFGTVMVGMISLSGLALAGLAFASSTIVAVALATIIGIMIGYTNVAVITWVQLRIPQALMGRVMSLLMFASVSLVPISIAVSGVLVQISLDGVLLVAGLGVSLVTVVALTSPRIRRMGLEPVLAEDGEPSIGTPSRQAAAAD